MFKNKKSTKEKGIGHLFLLMIAGGMAGGVVGGFSTKFEDVIAGAIESLKLLISTNIFGIYFVGSAILLISIVVTLKIGEKNLIDSIKNEEDIYNDAQLGISMALTGIIIPFMIGSLAICSGKIRTSIEINGYVDRNLMMLFGSAVALLLILSILIPLCQKRIIDKIKIAYPEKKGNIFTMSFKKDWEASMDERELKIMNQAANKTFTFTTIMLLIMIILAFILSLITDIGVYPVIILVLIFSVMMIVYTYWSIKLDK